MSNIRLPYRAAASSSRSIPSTPPVVSHTSGRSIAGTPPPIPRSRLSPTDLSRQTYYVYRDSGGGLPPFKIRITLSSQPDGAIPTSSRIGDTGASWSFKFNIDCFYATFRELLEHGLFFTIANATDRPQLQYNTDGSTVLKWPIQFDDDLPARPGWHGAATFTTPNSNLLHAATGSWSTFFREDNIASFIISDRHDAVIFAYRRRNRDVLIRAGGVFFHFCGFRLYSDASTCSEVGDLGGPDDNVAVESEGFFDDDTVMDQDVSDDKDYYADHSDLDSDLSVNDTDMDSATVDGDDHPCKAVDEGDGQPGGLDQPVSPAILHVACGLLDLRYGKGKWKDSQKLMSEATTPDSGSGLVE